MKVLFITHAFAPYYELGGPAYSVTRLAEELVKAGAKVRVILFLPPWVNDEKDYHSVNGVEVIIVRARSRTLAKIFGKARFTGVSNKFLTSEISKSDLVHVQISFLFPGWLVSRLAKKLRKPVCYHARGVLHPNRLRYGYMKKKLYYKIFERSIIRNAKLIIALNSVEKKALHDLTEENKIITIPNGIEPSPRSANQRDFTDGDVFELLYLGRLDQTKGIGELIEALHFLVSLEAKKSFNLNLVGADDKGYRARLEKQVSDLGLTESVVFHGHVFGKEKEELLQRANLFVLPSEAEGLSIAVLEALSANLPILITKECGFEQEIKNGLGEYCRKNPTDIYNGIIKIRDNYTSYAENASFKHREKYYSWPAIGKSMLRAYESCISHYENKY